MERRCEKMASSNPNYILHNYMAQQAIESAYKGDFSEFNRLSELIQKPFDVNEKFAEYTKKRPAWAQNKPGSSMLSCSS